VESVKLVRYHVVGEGTVRNGDACLNRGEHDGGDWITTMRKAGAEHETWSHAPLLRGARSKPKELQAKRMSLGLGFLALRFASIHEAKIQEGLQMKRYAARLQQICFQGARAGWERDGSFAFGVCLSSLLQITSPRPVRWP
jgi:hypothetical protein